MMISKKRQKAILTEKKDSLFEIYKSYIHTNSHTPSRVKADCSKHTNIKSLLKSSANIINSLWQNKMSLRAEQVENIRNCQNIQTNPVNLSEKYSFSL